MSYIANSRPLIESHPSHGLEVWKQSHVTKLHKDNHRIFTNYCWRSIIEIKVVDIDHHCKSAENPISTSLQMTTKICLHLI